MTWLQIIVLGIVQGAAELLPVSSSAHVIVAEKLLGLVPSGPQAMFVLAMLHTGTMFAVLAYFWRGWQESYFSSQARFVSVLVRVVAATALTGILGEILIQGIEHAFLVGHGTGDIEELSNNLWLVGGALVVAGIWIIAAGLRRAGPAPASGPSEVSLGSACGMGLAQGLCLPFRGLSRSGSTISTGLLMGSPRRAAEEFSFALAIVITPAVIFREFHRLHKAYPEAAHDGTFGPQLAPGLLGLAVSFFAGWLALLLLSRWLEEGRWSYFGYYCLAAAAVVFLLASAGY